MPNTTRKIKYKVSQKVSFPISFFRCTEVSEDKNSTQICLDFSLPFFYIVPKLVQERAITYDEIFLALAVEGDILLPTPFLDLGFDGTIRWKSPAFKIFFQFAKHMKV
jgi:hypothetical protein